MDDHDLAQIKYYIQRSSDSEIFSDYQKCNVNISYGEACVPSKKASQSNFLLPKKKAASGEHIPGIFRIFVDRWPLA